MLRHLATAVTCFTLGLWAGYSKPVASSVTKVKMIQPETYDLRNYDVFWQIEGEDKYIGLCRGPIIDHTIQTITCLMPKGTLAPWVRPMSESIEPSKEYAQARLDESNSR